MSGKSTVRSVSFNAKESRSFIRYIKALHPDLQNNLHLSTSPSMVSRRLIGLLASAYLSQGWVLASVPRALPLCASVCADKAAVFAGCSPCVLFFFPSPSVIDFEYCATTGPIHNAYVPRRRSLILLEYAWRIAVRATRLLLRQTIMLSAIHVCILLFRLPCRGNFWVEYNVSEWNLAPYLFSFARY